MMFNKCIVLFFLLIGFVFNIKAQTLDQKALEVINASEEVKLFLNFYEEKNIEVNPKIVVEGINAILIPRSKSVIGDGFVSGNSFFSTTQITLPPSNYGMSVEGYSKFEIFIVLDKYGYIRHIKFEPKNKHEVENLYKLKRLIGVSFYNVRMDDLNLEGLENVSEIMISNSDIIKVVLPKNNNIKVLLMSMTPVNLIENLDSLKMLDIFSVRGSEIKSLTSLKNSHNLRRFMFKNNNKGILTELPDFSLMPKLEFLHFFSGETNNIKNIGALSNLKVLFTSLDFDYSNIIFPKSLEYLHTGGFMNKNLPNLKGNFNLKEVIVSGTSSKEISGLDDLEKLRLLVLSRSKINEISGLDNLSNLEELNLSGNEITKVEGLDDLENIKFIKLNKNKITKVEGLKNLFGVKGISFEHNPIETLDFSEIEHLKNTKVLMWYTPFWKSATKEDKRKLDNLARKGHL